MSNEKASAGLSEKKNLMVGKKQTESRTAQ